MLLLEHVLVHEVLLLQEQLLLLVQGRLLLRNIVWWQRKPRLRPSARAWLSWRLLYMHTLPLKRLITDRLP